MRKFTMLSMLLLLVVSALALVVGGCDRPTAQMERAERAINEAKKAGAAEYAPGALANAQQAFSRGQGSMDAFSYAAARADFEKAYREAMAAKKQALASNGKNWTDLKTPGATVNGSMPVVHKVYEGENLWRISEYSDVLADPFQWPLIYDANRDEIDDTAHSRGYFTDEHNWIFPGQELQIPRTSTISEISAARKLAGAPEPYLAVGK